MRRPFCSLLPFPCTRPMYSIVLHIKTCYTTRSSLACSFLPVALLFN